MEGADGVKRWASQTGSPVDVEAGFPHEPGGGSSMRPDTPAFMSLARRPKTTTRKIARFQSGFPEVCFEIFQTIAWLKSAIRCFCSGALPESLRASRLLPLLSI